MIKTRGDLARFKARHVYENELRVLRDLIEEGERASEKIYWLEIELLEARGALKAIEWRISEQGPVIEAARLAAGVGLNEPEKD
jgi:hypothetical protein